MKCKTHVGWWTKGDTEPAMGDHAIHKAILRTTRPIILLDIDGQPAVGQGGKIAIGDGDFSGPESYPLEAYVPALYPENLGDPSFKQAYNLRCAYVAGAKANGITSVEMVEAAGHAGMIGFFGAAGLALDKIETAIDRQMITAQEARLAESIPVALYMDQHVPRAITVGLRLRDIDVVTAFEDGRSEMGDSELLDRAGELGRVLFTDDDLIIEATKRQRSGVEFRGLIYAHQLHISIGTCIRHLEIIAKAGEPEDLINKVQFLPF